MRVTIIKEDSVVGVDGVFRKINLSSLDSDIRAVQWDGTKGHVERYSGNETALNSIAAYQSFVDLWTAAAPQIPVPTTQDLIASAHSRINLAYQTAVNAAISEYPFLEILSWPKQEAEARAYLASNLASVPWLQSAALSRGITKTELANKIVANADAFAVISGNLTGKRQKLRDQILALGETPTQAQLDAIQW